MRPKFHKTANIAEAPVFAKPKYVCGKEGKNFFSPNFSIFPVEGLHVGRRKPHGDNSIWK
jgi:hypothetical protein